MESSDRLTALDATFLELEERDECAHMHIGAVMILEPRPSQGPPPIDREGQYAERPIPASSLRSMSSPPLQSQTQFPTGISRALSLAPSDSTPSTTREARNHPLT